MVWIATERARKLRQRQTPEERKLWGFLRNKRFHNLKFRRQHPILYGTPNDYFIADFYCAEKKTVIELDGKIHLNTKDYDKFRDEIIRSLRIKVIRIKNEEVQEMDKLIKKLTRLICT